MVSNWTETQESIEARKARILADYTPEVQQGESELTKALRDFCEAVDELEGQVENLKANHTKPAQPAPRSIFDTVLIAWIVWGGILLIFGAAGIALAGG